MSSLTRSSAWRALLAHKKRMASVHMRDLFRNDPARFQRFSLQFNDILFDYSKNIIDEETMRFLFDLARQEELGAWINKMFSGEKINFTENRAVLHIALRNRQNRPINVGGKNVMAEVNRVLAQMRSFSEQVRSAAWTGFSGIPITDIVNIGIGGSDLGPLMAVTALVPYGHPRLKIHFVSNIDASHLLETLKGLKAHTTLFIVASKTFTTPETLTNAHSARDWFLRAATEADIARHFVAISTNEAEVSKFGIDPKNMFEFWDWVGGRYSLWSAIGLSLAIYIGMDSFEDMLTGAFEVDEHFRTAPMEQNIPVIMALLGVWYNNFFAAQTHAILPYDQRLARFPAYLQQLDMESNGKSITRSGKTVDYNTAPIIWGEPGTNGQHAFYQLIHQGSKLIPADFLAAIETHYPLDHHHTMLMANYFAQTEALMKGKTSAEAHAELAVSGMSSTRQRQLLAHKIFSGNKPSDSILYQRLDPKTLGALIAIYEHKVFTQGIIWNINSFDQWGVELGKQLAKTIEGELQGTTENAGHDASTSGLIDYYQRHAPHSSRQ